MSQTDLELSCWQHDRQAFDGAGPIDASVFASYPRVRDYLLGRTSDPNLEAAVDALERLGQVQGHDLVGFSVMGSKQLPVALCLSQRIKEKYGTATVLGGAFISAYASLILERFDFIDYAVVGEGWRSVCDLVRAIEARTPAALCTVPGLCHRVDGIVVNRPPAPPPIDSMPAPDFDGLALEGYREQVRVSYGCHAAVPIFPYVLSHGCIRTCAFCGRSALRKWQLPPGMGIEMKSIEKIVREIGALTRRYDARYFRFICPEVNASDHWARTLADAIISEGLDIRWHGYAIPAGLSAETTDRLFESGCRLLRYGVETGSRKLLAAMRKGFSVDEARAVLDRSHRSGIWNHVNLMVGYPYEDAEDIDDTRALILDDADRIDSIRVNPYVLHRDSWLCEHAEAEGLRLSGGEGDFPAFDEVRTGLPWKDKKRQTLDFHRRLADAIRESHAGVPVSFELITAGFMLFDRKKDVSDWLRQNHPAFYAPDTLDLIERKIRDPNLTH